LKKESKKLSNGTLTTPEHGVTKNTDGNGAIKKCLENKENLT